MPFPRLGTGGGQLSPARPRPARRRRHRGAARRPGWPVCPGGRSHRPQYGRGPYPRPGERRRRLCDQPFSPTEVVLRVQAVLARGSTGGCPEISGPASFGHGRLRIDETRHEASLPTGAGGSGGPPGAAPEIRAHSIVGLQAPSPLPRRISPPEYASAQTVCRRHRDHVENSPGVLWRG
jgi:hypothetical protein